jgi:hypothetical protein
MTCARFDGRRRGSRPVAAGVALIAVFVATLAAADEGPGDCLGVGFDVQHLVTIAKIIADRPQVHFVKNASDDNSCPAERESCTQPSYLVPGDLLLVGKTRGAYSCVSYQSAADRSQNWTVGWLPSASLTPVQPARATKPADWIGRWIHAGGTITISKGRHGTVRITDEQTDPAGRNVHSGIFKVEAKPAQGVLEFALMADAQNCLVRMRRIAELLVVEDNNHCGGAMVSSTGFYQRKR